VWLGKLNSKNDLEMLSLTMVEESQSFTDERGQAVRGLTYRVPEIRVKKSKLSAVERAQKRREKELQRRTIDAARKIDLRLVVAGTEEQQEALRREILDIDNIPPEGAKEVLGALFSTDTVDFSALADNDRIGGEFRVDEGNLQSEILPGLMDKVLEINAGELSYWATKAGVSENQCVLDRHIRFMPATGVDDVTVIGVDVRIFPDGYKREDQVVVEHFLLKEGVTMESKGS
jgi:hypothetical protein